MSHKILLIEDSLTQLETLKRQLLKAGFDVETARDGKEGYQKVFSTAPDLILSDIIMPEFNGCQVSNILKNSPITKQIPIILLTVLDKKLDKFWALKSGAEKFVSKTTPFEQLVQIIKEQIHKNPVSDDYKQALIERQLNSDEIQDHLIVTLDEFFMNTMLMGDFRDLTNSLSHEKVLIEKTFELLDSFIDYNIAGIFFNNLDRNDKKVLHLDILKNPISSFVVEKIKRDFFSQMPDLGDFSIRDYRHDIVREKFEDNNTILSDNEFSSKLILPIISEGNLLGGVCLFGKKEKNYSESKIYNTLVRELTVLFKMKYLYSETEYLSVTDGLTGLYNRRHFEYNLQREFLRTKRYPSELSLAMIDIDYFKKINDNYGHQFGDYVLKELSVMISDSLRKTDMVYRYGGEEIAVILTETSMENAAIPLDRLRIKISNHLFKYEDQEANVSISIGISSNNKEINSERELIECADKALYKAKQEGRNRIISFKNEELNQILQ